MQRRNFLKKIGLLSVFSTASIGTAIASENKTADGRVTGEVSCNGMGIENVLVSDGFGIVVTNSAGKFSINPHSNANYIFVSLPSGYEFPHNKGVANFYQLIDKTKAAQKINFELTKLSQQDDKHAFIIWGDTQIKSKEDAELLKTTSAVDTAATVKALGNLPIHGIAVGDLVFDQFDLFPDYKQAVETTSIPFFQAIGNHDMDYAAYGDDSSQNTYQQHFGPTYYSFNRGKIHYVILDDVFFIGKGHGYIGYITEPQLKWLEADLAFVPKGSTVVVSLHIPTKSREKERTKAKKEELAGIVTNRDVLYKILQPYKVHIMSGHTHYNENWEKDNMYEHNHGTVCGAWWSGPICGDGTPSGYGVYLVDGNDINWYYKSTGIDKMHQFNIYKRGHLKSRPNEVLINAWNYDEKWKVEWWEDEVYKGNANRVIELDPWAIELYLGDKLPEKHKWVEPVLTDHLFSCIPSSTAKQIKVKVTDRFNHSYEKTLEL